MNYKKPLISVAIYLRGDQLDPGHVSEQLGIQPARTQKKGEPKAGSTRFIAKIGVWTIKVKSESRPLPDLVDEIFEKIGDLSMRLDRVQGVEDACLDILFALDDGTNQTIEFALTQKQIARASQLGLSVCVTVM